MFIVQGKPREPEGIIKVRGEGDAVGRLSNQRTSFSNKECPSSLSSPTAGYTRLKFALTLQMRERKVRGTLAERGRKPEH